MRRGRLFQQLFEENKILHECWVSLAVNVLQEYRLVACWDCSIQHAEDTPPFALATKSIMSTYATKIKNKNRSRWKIIEKVQNLEVVVTCTYTSASASGCMI